METTEKTLAELSAREKSISAALRKNQEERTRLMGEQREVDALRYDLQREESQKSTHASNKANASISALLKADKMRQLQKVFGVKTDPTAPSKQPEPAKKAKEKAE